MNISAKLDRALYGPLGGRRHLWVRIEVPRTTAPTERAPLGIGLVLDRSGSMEGVKIDLSRQAARATVRALRDEDSCALVAYDNEVIRCVAAGRADASQKARVCEALDRLHARGSTDLFAGWLAGAEEISRESSEAIRRVVLLTDGLANQGLTDHGQIIEHVRQLALRGVGTSTFGVGRDFDEHLVADMAEAGGGHFYYLERPQQIPDNLASELGELLSVIARGVTLSVTSSAGVGMLSLNGLPARDGRLDVGDLSEESTTDLFFALDVPADAPATIDLRVDAAWTAAGDGKNQRQVMEIKLRAVNEDEARAETADSETIIQVAKTRSAQVREEALSLNRKGGFVAASAMLNSEAGTMFDLSELPEVREETAELRRLADEMSAPMDAKAAKQMKYASYMQRRSRKDPGEK